MFNKNRPGVGSNARVVTKADLEDPQMRAHIRYNVKGKEKMNKIQETYKKGSYEDKMTRQAIADHNKQTKGFRDPNYVKTRAKIAEKDSIESTSHKLIKKMAGKMAEQKTKMSIKGYKHAVHHTIHGPKRGYADERGYIYPSKGAYNDRYQGK